MTLRYLGPCVLGTPGTLDYWTSFLLLYLFILPLTSSYLFLLLSSIGMVWYGVGEGRGGSFDIGDWDWLMEIDRWALYWCWKVMGGGWMVVGCTLDYSSGPFLSYEIEIGDGPLTFILILKSCGVGRWNPGTSSFLLHSLPLTSSHLLLIPPTSFLFLPSTPPSSQTSS